MWSFAVGMFMIALSPDSLRLTAIYGLTGGLAILLTGAILGDWVDSYPRMRGEPRGRCVSSQMVILMSLDSETILVELECLAASCCALQHPQLGVGLEIKGSLCLL